MVEQAGFYRDVEATDAGAILIAPGDAHGRVALKAGADRLMVAVTGEPTGECLLECFRTGVERKIIQPDMRTLVDLTRFFGGVDWKLIFALRNLAPWGEGGTGNSRVAYLFRDGDFGAAIKIVSAMFTRTRHRGFTDRALAIEWLEMGEERSADAISGG
jgi:hypothetical protein